MDTPEELLRDKWIERHKGMCGTCRYKADGVCKNECSYLYYELVGDNDMCDEWSERDYAKSLSETIKKTMERLKKK